jgi:hypothetical protein
MIVARDVYYVIFLTVSALRVRVFTKPTGDSWSFLGSEWNLLFVSEDWLEAVWYPSR